MTRNTVAIIGAGMAGLACADRLRRAGWSVRLFDKARGPGGRLATRRVVLADGRELGFDHGAQYVTAHDPGFAAVLARLERDGVVGPYPWPIFCQSRRGADAKAADNRLVGLAGMNAIAKAMAKPHPFEANRQVSSLSRSAAGWRVAFTDGPSEGGFTAVVLAIPAAQARDLLAEVAPDLAEEAAATRTAPCWAGLFAFEGGGEPAFGAVGMEDGGPLSWLARTGDGQGWVAHATPAWSRLNLELPSDVVAAALEAAVREVLPDVGETMACQAHRWRFARVETPAATPFAWNPDKMLGLCGDWRLGPRAELAWRSGDGLGAAMAVEAAHA